ncbi:YlbL family protein [Arthrobacter sp. 35W]|uniref:YlbL family protein n=1 Tax=Arthrobacter sp. 35W TaxID=1132441 RepID=UPI0003F8574F|nr:S16 family serine protease [Arthrobacter sp. 35W]
MSEETPAGPVVPTAAARPRDGRFSTMAVSGVLAAVLGAAALLMPVPYVVESPGPTFNTLGKENGTPIIQISGADTYPVTGSLDMVTVRQGGGLPGNSINILEALQGWADPDKAVFPAELIYPPGTTAQDANTAGAAAMTSSQDTSTAAALNQLGIKYTTELTVAQIPAGSASEGKLKVGDVVLAVDGAPVTDLSVIQQALADGAGKPVAVRVKRGGAEQDVSVAPTLGDNGKYLLGISLQTVPTFPFEVKFGLQNITGPSAGMMFALAIIDTLTPSDITGGKHFAGTGTIDPQGNVGAIGGIAQKMIGARNSGATVFLAPGANCNDVVGHVPDGLQVVKVDTLTEAYDAVKLIGSGADGSTLPTCTAG